MTEPEETEADAPAGRWTQLPRWQHIVLIALGALGLFAAITNVISSSSNGARALHGLFAVLVGVLLVALLRAYRRRPPE